MDVRPPEMARPRDVYSLSHVAMPFPTSDPVYGREEAGALPATIRLGVLSPRRERAVLSVPSDTLLRLTCSPFFRSLSARTAAWVTPAPEVPRLSSR